MSDMDYDDWTDADWKAEFAIGEQDRRLAEIERLRSVETGYLARGLTIDRLTEQNTKLTRELAFAHTEINRLNNELLEIGDVRRELAEARDALKAWHDWYWNANCTGIAEETLDATNKILERKCDHEFVGAACAKCGEALYDF